jgi:hypothetical protein
MLIPHKLEVESAINYIPELPSFKAFWHLLLLKWVILGSVNFRYTCNDTPGDSVPGLGRKRACERRPPTPPDEGKKSKGPEKS